LNQPGDFVLEEIRKLSRFDLPSYSFEQAHSHPVQVDGGSTMASLYWKNNSALLFVANLSPKDTTVALRVDLARKGWPSRQKLNLLTSGRNALLSVRELAGNGVRLRVPGLSSRVIECRLCTPPGRTMRSRVGQRAHHEV
jgi:hypothetical protein